MDLGLFFAWWFGLISGVGIGLAIAHLIRGGSLVTRGRHYWSAGEVRAAALAWIAVFVLIAIYALVSSYALANHTFLFGPSGGNGITVILFIGLTTNGIVELHHRRWWPFAK